MIWLVFALLTGAAILGLLMPLARRTRERSKQDSDVAFYKAQLAEIEHDLERGLIGNADAEAARAQAGRRLLSAASAEGAEGALGSTRAKRIAAALCLIVVPSVTLGVYSYLGSPDIPDQPLSARLNSAPDKMDLGIALAKIEQHLSEDPEDGRGWDLIAPVYLQLGRFADAAKAYGAAIRILGETEARERSLGEALTADGGGTIDETARAAFAKAAELEPNDPAPHFYLGLAAAQTGDRASARETWTKLLADAPPDAPWAAMVRSQLTQLDAPAGATTPSLPPGRVGGAAPDASEAASVAAMPSDQQATFIKSMVAQLAQRLASQGGDIDEWSRLVRAYTVLQDKDKALTALSDARKNLAKDDAALARLTALARELGLES